MRRLSFAQVMLMVVLFLITLTMIIPILNVVAVSFSSPTASRELSGLAIIPKEFYLGNYQLVFSHPMLFRSLWNSIFITIVGTAINLVLTTMAAYALTRPGLVFKKAIMVFLIIMMLFDPGLIPEYLLVKDLKLIGSQWSVILVTAVNVYYLIIMMRYFEEIPDSIMEAAYLDGAGHICTLTRIVLPLTRAGVITIGMFYAVLRWNEYIKAGMYISTPSKTTLQVILRRFVVDNDTASLLGATNLMSYNEIAKMDYTAIKYATIVVAIVPILLLYPIVLKTYTKNVISGGVKE